MNNPSEIIEEYEYQDIVNEFKAISDDEEYLFIDRKKGKRNLLISLATLKNNGIYASAMAYYRHFDGDVIFLTDKENSYYFHKDNGVKIKKLVQTLIDGYDPKKIIFCGASMAGFSAIDMALYFNANAITNNPQINLDKTSELAWSELRNFINEIPLKYNIDDLPYRNTESVIAALFGQHPLDKENRKSFLDFSNRMPGIGIILGNSYDIEHKYF